MACRILVVDDEPTILFAIGKYFRHLHYEVHCAQTVEEADSRLESTSYALLITDLRLGTKDRDQGLELVRHVREKGLSTRIVLLTAYGTPEIEARARQLGVDAIVRKPKPLSDIAQIVAWLLWNVRSTSGSSHAELPRKSPARDQSLGEAGRKLSRKH